MFRDSKEWQALGTKLSKHLGFNEHELDETKKIRIYHYYVPVFVWCKRQLNLHNVKHQGSDPVPALVVISTTLSIKSRVHDGSTGTMLCEATILNFVKWVVGSIVAKDNAI